MTKYAIRDLCHICHQRVTEGTIWHRGTRVHDACYLTLDFTGRLKVGFGHGYTGGTK